MFDLNPLLQSHSRRSLVAIDSRELRGCLPSRHLIQGPRSLMRRTTVSNA